MNNTATSRGSDTPRPTKHWPAEVKEKAANKEEMRSLMAERLPALDRDEAGRWVSAVDHPFIFEDCSNSDALTFTCAGMTGVRMVELIRKAITREIAHTGAAGAERVALLRECRETWLAVQKLAFADERSCVMKIEKLDFLGGVQRHEPQDGMCVTFVGSTDADPDPDADLAESLMYFDPPPPHNLQAAWGMKANIYDRIVEVAVSHIRETAVDLGKAFNDPAPR